MIRARLTRLALLVVPTLMIASCGRSDGPPAPPKASDFVGTWQIDIEEAVRRSIEWQKKKLYERMPIPDETITRTQLEIAEQSARMRLQNVHVELVLKDDGTCTFRGSGGAASANAPHASGTWTYEDGEVRLSILPASAGPATPPREMILTVNGSHLDWTPPAEKFGIVPLGRDIPSPDGEEAPSDG